MGKEKRDNIIVTGGLGFIGSHFIDLALKSGFNVVNIDKVTYASFIYINGYFKNIYGDRYKFIKKDINDLKKLPEAKYLVHFAAESHVDNAIKNSSVFIKSNVLGTQNILDLLAKMKKTGEKTPILVYISTDEVFGDIGKGFFKETDRLNPSNPYSASKAAAEMLIIAYGRTYDLPYKITRTTNNYGDRQHHEKLIPNCVLHILKGEPIKIHGSGSQIRNWIHVKDNAKAIFEVMARGRVNGIYHIASKDEFSVKQAGEMILKNFGKPFDESTVNYIEDRAGQDVRYALDTTCIETELNWAPGYKFETCLPELIADYKIKYKKGKWPYHKRSLIKLWQR